jgi:hypothetical protein
MKVSTENRPVDALTEGNSPQRVVERISAMMAIWNPLMKTFCDRNLEEGRK